MNNKKNKLQGLLALLTYFIISYNIKDILGIFNISLSNWSPKDIFIFDIIYEFILLFIIFLILKDTIIKDFKEYFSNIKYYLKKYIKYWFLALLLMYVSNIIITIFTNSIPQNEESVRKLFDFNPILTCILACVIAPLLEEFVFRLSIYKILKNNKWLFIMCSGLLFGSMHVLGNVNEWTDLLFIVPYSIPGCVFAYTLYDSDNIFVSSSLHFIHNTFAIILQIIGSKI